MDPRRGDRGRVKERLAGILAEIPAGKSDSWSR
jgi:hypothetical protein